MTDSSDVLCSICFEEASQCCERTVVTLKCSHKFHLDCIGSYFNHRGFMQCPNCRAIENGDWQQSIHHTSGSNVVNFGAAENQEPEIEGFLVNGLPEQQASSNYGAINYPINFGATSPDNTFLNSEGFDNQDVITDYPLTMVSHNPLTMGSEIIGTDLNNAPVAVGMGSDADVFISYSELLAQLYTETHSQADTRSQAHQRNAATHIITISDDENDDGDGDEDEPIITILND